MTTEIQTQTVTSDSGEQDPMSSLNNRLSKLETSHQARLNRPPLSMTERVAKISGLLAIATENLGVDSGDLQSIATRATGPATQIARHLLRVQ